MENKTQDEIIDKIIKKIVSNPSLDSRAKQVCVVYIREAIKETEDKYKELLKEVRTKFAHGCNCENCEKLRNKIDEVLK